VFNQLNQSTWRLLGVLLLLGIVSGLVAAATAGLLFRGLSLLSFVIADQIDGWLAFGAFALLLLISVLVSGVAGGLIGSLIGGMMVRRRWHPSRRWLIAWVVVWMVGGLIVWVPAAQTDAVLTLASIGWWMLLGVIIALAFAVISPPWRLLPPHD
jgi:LytS/YehU family sensor histidine kinase